MYPNNLQPEYDRFEIFSFPQMAGQNIDGVLLSDFCHGNAQLKKAEPNVQSVFESQPKFEDTIDSKMENAKTPPKDNSEAG